MAIILTVQINLTMQKKDGGHMATILMVQTKTDMWRPFLTVQIKTDIRRPFLTVQIDGHQATILSYFTHD